MKKHFTVSPKLTNKRRVTASTSDSYPSTNQLERMLNSSDEDIYLAAIDLRDDMLESDDGDVRRAALNNIEDQDVIAEFVDDPYPWVRYTVAWKSTDPEILMQLATDPHPEVKSTAIETLKRRGLWAPNTSTQLKFDKACQKVFNRFGPDVSDCIDIIKKSIYAFENGKTTSKIPKILAEQGLPLATDTFLEWVARKFPDVDLSDY